MDVALRLRPLLGFSACLFPLAATAAEPCVGECFETSAVCAPPLDECDSDACGNGGSCLTGRGATSTSGATRSGRGCRVIGGRGWSQKRERDEHGDWFDSDHDTGPVGSSQKCRHGKLWPPYPRPQENGEWSTQFHAAMYWPHPYDCWDRSWVRQITATQAANGWAQATTIYDYHFDSETHCLNSSGQEHLRWILEQCPPQYRAINVQAGNARAVSDARVASVEAQVAEISGLASAPIMVRPVRLAGRPASEVDKIRRGELSATPRIHVDVPTLVGGGAAAATE